MTVELALSEFLKRHNLSAYRLEVELKGELNRNTIYAFAKSGGMKRIDLESLSKILSALSALIGRTVRLDEIFHVRDDQPRELRTARAGVPYTGHKTTNDVLDAYPNILVELAEAKKL